MQCPVCSHANSDDARFCANCGTSLELTCPTCSAPYVAGQRFCDQCGTALTADAAADAAPAVEDLSRWVPEELLRKIRAAQSGQTMRGERRTVTMLFADLQGSTAAAEQLDPEEWAEIVNETFTVLIEPIYRYEGTLARLQGDAILAFFGAPIAHEDDAVRAVRAGLDIVTEMERHTSPAAQRLGVPIQVRVGINTGLVVVGEVGSDLRVEYTALGDAINVAARMEQTAEPGSVRVTQDTLDLVGNDVSTELIGPVDVKGRADPVIAHRVTSVSDRIEFTGAPATQLVGRDDELARLGDALERLEAGVGGICTIVGDAGMGKTRLVLALRGRLADHASISDVTTDVGTVAWLQARARSYETSRPHAVFGHLLTAWLGGTGGIEDSAHVERTLAALQGLADDDAMFISALLDISQPPEEQAFLDGLAPGALHERTMSAVTALFAAESSVRPTVLVLDDMHWADSLSLELTERALELTESHPVLLVVMMRPVRDDPSWRLVEIAARDHAHRCTPIELDALSDEAADEMLATLLGDPVIDDRLRGDVLRRAGGNPLFVEEMVRSLDEANEGDDGDGASSRRPRVPRTLTSLLTSRLDRLDESTRHVAQVASLVGREFSVPALSALVDDPAILDTDIRELVRRGILEERRRLPEPAYAFRHPLIAEAAYSTILLKTRRMLHERVAQHLEENDPQASPEIARHWVEAGESARAFPHLLDAGQRAIRVMALSDAIASFSLALEHVPEDADPDLVATAHDGLGEAWSRVPDLSQASAAFQSLFEHGVKTGQPSVQVTALNRLGFTTATITNDWERAMDYLQEARALAEEVDDEIGLAEYHMNACFVMAGMGNVEAAILHDEETARIGDVIGNEDIRLTGLLRRTMNLINVLRFDEAMQSFEETMESARETGDELLKALLHAEVEGSIALRDGRIASATEIINEQVPTIDRHLTNYGGVQHLRLGQAALWLGDFELALAEYATAERYGGSVHQAALVAGGVAGRAMGLAVVDPSADIALGPTAEFVSTGILADLGWAFIHLGRLERASERLTQAYGSSAMTRAWELPRALLGLAHVALAQGQQDEAVRWLDEARAYIAEHELLVHEPELFLLDGWAAELGGRDEDAAMVLTESIRTATESGRRPVRMDALRRLAGVRRGQGDGDEAKALDERASLIAREIAAGIADEDLRRAWVTRTRTAVDAADRGPAA